VIALADDRPEDLGHGPHEALLVPVMRGGKRVAPAETLEAIRARAKTSLASLPAELHLLDEPTPAWRGLVPSTSPRLAALVEEVRKTYGAATTPAKGEKA
jgi:nicotinate phosphoribosyltransferase